MTKPETIIRKYIKIDCPECDLSHMIYHPNDAIRDLECPKCRWCGTKEFVRHLTLEDIEEIREERRAMFEFRMQQQLIRTSAPSFARPTAKQRRLEKELKTIKPLDQFLKVGK